MTEYKDIHVGDVFRPTLSYRYWLVIAKNDKDQLIQVKPEYSFVDGDPWFPADNGVFSFREPKEAYVPGGRHCFNCATALEECGECRVHYGGQKMSAWTGPKEKE